MFAGVGERTREGNDLYREMIESGVIKLGDKQVIGDALLHFFCWLHLITHDLYFLLHLNYIKLGDKRVIGDIPLQFFHLFHLMIHDL